MTALLDIPIELGAPEVRGPLTLFPIIGPAPEAPPYLTGPQAEHLEVLAIGELDTAAQVPELIVQNAGLLPVLLVEGETVIGNKQNRTLNLSVLCAGGGATAIPVSCVDAGRWAAPESAALSRRHAPQALRARKVQSVRESVLGGEGKHSDQGRVWADVNEYATRHNVSSQSGALEDVFEAVESESNRLLDGLRPTADQRGVLVGIGGRPVGIDLFDRPSTLLDYWDGLLAGYALEAISAKPEATIVDRAEAFVAALLTSSVVEQPGSGLGVEVHLVHDRLAGVALRWKGAVVHFGAFSVEPDRGTRRPSRPISRRR